MQGVSPIPLLARAVVQILTIALVFRRYGEMTIVEWGYDGYFGARPNNPATHPYRPAAHISYTRPVPQRPEQPVQQHPEQILPKRDQENPRHSVVRRRQGTDTESYRRAIYNDAP